MISPSSGDDLGTCEDAQRRLLDLDVDEGARQVLATTLEHVARCEACRRAMADFDRVRGALAPREGASSDAEPAGGWGEFEGRLMGALTRAGCVGEVADRRGARPWLRRVVAVAASLLLAAGIFAWGRAGATADKRVAAGDGGPSAPRAVIALLSKAEVSRQFGVFGEVNQVFEGHTRWLLLTSGGADVGLDESPAVPAPSAAAAAARAGQERVMLLRLSVSRGSEVVSTADVVIVAGKTAELHVPMQDGRTLRYRLATSDTDPSKLALRAELRGRAPSGGGGGGDAVEPQAALATDLHLRPDSGASAGQLIAPSGHYEIKVLYAPSSL